MKLTGMFLFLFSTVVPFSTVSGQSVLFDFDNIPSHTPFPVSQTVSGITAYFSGTGQGYSIQDASVLGFTPHGFSGHVIYPNSINLTDLLINFSQKITDFSIMYSCQELGCDDAATMRVTAYMKGILVGTHTKTATNPGTWPTDTLACSFTQGFDSVVVHYDKRPPTCQDYGVVYLADNMRVTPAYTGMPNFDSYIEKVIVPNPVSGCATLSLSLLQPQYISILVYDITGRPVQQLFDGYWSAGLHDIKWDVTTNAIKPGMYIIKISGSHFSQSYSLMVDG